MDFLEKYQASHQHPLNKLCHTIGIPLILISLGCLAWDFRWAAGLFVLGWIFQFLGHAFERKAPAFFSDLRFLAIGPLWLLKRLFSPTKREA